MFSRVIKIAIGVNKTVEKVNTIPLLGFINDIPEVVIANPDPQKSSVIIKSTCFSFNDLSFFL